MNWDQGCNTGQGPESPAVSCQELTLESLNHGGDWWALGGRVRLSGRFLSGGLEAAVLYQLEADSILTNTIVSLGYNQ